MVFNATFNNTGTSDCFPNTSFDSIVYYLCLFVCLMVLSPTFNNISVTSWRSVLLVEKSGVPG